MTDRKQDGLPGVVVVSLQTRAPLEVPYFYGLVVPTRYRKPAVENTRPDQWRCSQTISRGTGSPGQRLTAPCNSQT
jgi:hypothetical protein